MNNEKKETNQNTIRKLLILCFGVLVGLPSLAQVNTPDTPTSKFWEAWEFIKDFPAQVTRKGYNRFVFEPGQGDTATYIYTITRVKKVWAPPLPVYDTTWTATDVDNKSTAIVYAPAGAWTAGSGAAKFLNGTFQYGSGGGTTLRTATYTVTSTQPVRISFYSERFLGHGAYTVKVGSLEAASINAGVATYNTDKDRGKASYRSPILPAGIYTVTVSTAQQMVVDFIKVEKLTLTPRP